MKTLARQQVKEAISGEEHTSLKYDGTTKPSHHLVEMKISTQDHQYVIGLREQDGGTATKYHATLKEALHDTVVHVARFRRKTANMPCDFPNSTTCILLFFPLLMCIYYIM